MAVRRHWRIYHCSNPAGAFALQNLEYGEPSPFLCSAGCWCLVLSHNWVNDLSNVVNLSEISSVFCTAESPVVHHDIMSLTISSTFWTCGSATVACTVKSHAIVVSSSQRRSRSCRCTAPGEPPRFSGFFPNREHLPASQRHVIDDPVTVLHLWERHGLLHFRIKRHGLRLRYLNEPSGSAR